MKLYSSIEAFIEKAKTESIPAERKAMLKKLTHYIQQKIDKDERAQLNFICTHNSRRSQFSQIWAQTIADLFKVPVSCFSGGVEVTSFNDRAVASIKRAGFKVTMQDGENPRYYVSHSDDADPIVAFSKVYDDPANAPSGFAAVMTCSHADENCPYIPGAEARIPVRYEDPKSFDGTAMESEKYDERSLQIAAEMVYVFSRINLS